jgi:SAM-dependent methyltransferase
MEQPALSTTPGGHFDPGAYEVLRKCEDRHFWFRARKRIIRVLLQQIAAGLGKGLRAIEAGCGNGHLLGLLEEIKETSCVVGVDLFPEGLLNARTRVSCPLIRGDIRDIAFRLPFDLACLFDVLEHIDDDVAVLEHLYGLLRPSGILFLTVPAHPALWSDFDKEAGHRRRYTRKILEGKLLRAGFTVDYITHFMSPLLPLVWAKRQWSDALARQIGRSRGDGTPVVRSDLVMIPLVNGILECLTAAELPLVHRRRTIPFGSSLLVLASRKAVPPVEGLHRQAETAFHSSIPAPSEGRFGTDPAQIPKILGERSSFGKASSTVSPVSH